MRVGMGTVADTRRPAQVRGPEETMGSGVNGERYYQGCGFVKWHLFRKNTLCEPSFCGEHVPPV